ncbi:MAG: hypothetical protein OXR64_02885 [Chloroflexota bacterium]|nr:hypothetical protein [Chloroflexota bacterium]
MATKAERLARLEGAFNHLARKADLANLETRLMKWFARVPILVIINLLASATGILTALLGLQSRLPEWRIILGLSNPVGCGLLALPGTRAAL